MTLATASSPAVGSRPPMTSRGSRDRVSLYRCLSPSCTQLLSWGCESEMFIRDPGFIQYRRGKKKNLKIPPLNLNENYIIIIFFIGAEITGQLTKNLYK
jgi:hypothetical protein